MFSFVCGDGMRKCPVDDAVLNLRPIDVSDREAVRQILAVPELSRLQILSGLKSLHPVAWSDRLRTFGIRLGNHLFGALELKRDDEEPDRGNGHRVA